MTTEHAEYTEKDEELESILRDDKGEIISTLEHSKPTHLKERKRHSQQNGVSMAFLTFCTSLSFFVNAVSLIAQGCCLSIVFVIVLVFGIIILGEVKNSTSSVGEWNSINNIVSNTYTLLENVANVVGIRTSQSTPPPTLIVQITIDQLRADEIMKFRKRFIPDGGFDRMFKKGTFYRNAHYRHSRCVTPVGHSTLHTGGLPFSHGIIGHSFLDSDLGRIVEATENLNYTETGGEENITCTAPTYLLSSTTGDELRLFTNKSKVFSVSEKDYVSILQAGHLGKSYWWSTETGNFISSTFFFDEYPSYVADWNSRKIADSYEDKFWELTYQQHLYHFQDRKYVMPGFELGKKFPKPLYNENIEDYYDTLLQTPIGDQIMWNFAKSVILEEELGIRLDEEREDGDIIDMLALSFSALDKIGHVNGPNSIEYEDTIYKLDELMRDILDFLDSKIGLEKCLIVLSSDHGVDIAWRKAHDLRYATAGTFYTEHTIPLLEEYLNETLFENKMSSGIILGFPKANLYFDHQKITDGMVTVDEVSKASAEWLEKTYPHRILFAFTNREIREGRVPRTHLGDGVMLSYHPTRTGDVVILVDEHTYLGDKPKAEVTKHGTAWSFDSFVPIFFMGKDIPQGTVVDRRVSPEDIAPTLTTYFGINAPTGCTGNPLFEVLKNHDVNPFEN